MEQVADHPIWWDLVEDIARIVDDETQDPVSIKDDIELYLIEIIQLGYIEEPHYEAIAQAAVKYGIDLTEECDVGLTEEERVDNILECLDRELNSRSRYHDV